MDLRQLRYFVAVAERGGFAAAASTLNVAQSALSRHVKELEHELGGKLLERGARGVSVTESGKVLLARGRWLLKTIDDIKAEVRTENGEPSGTVRIGAPSSLADILYAPFAQLFIKQFPRVRLELSEGLTEGTSHSPMIISTTRSWLSSRCFSSARHATPCSSAARSPGRNSVTSRPPSHHSAATHFRQRCRFHCASIAAYR
jgi:molybdenum-dependent DNA-binding transcriptional regulator ModE